MNKQFKFFIFWFIAFFVAVAVAMVTRNAISIDISLVLLMLLGLVMVITTTKDAFLSLSSKNWPTTAFTVLNSRIIRRANSANNYNAYFELGYDVAGHTYELDCNALNIPIHSSQEGAERYVQQVKAGEFGKVVHYNPNNPVQAYVKPGIKLQHVLAVIFGLGFVAVPLAVILDYV